MIYKIGKNLIFFIGEAMQYKLIGGFVLAITCLLAADTCWDINTIRAYVHNSDMQRRWAMAFIAPYLKELKGNERILDIGCGDGRITADISRFIPKGTILGIDPSKSMLEWAKKQYSPLEYPNLFFQEGSFSSPSLLESFDLIFSNCALHCSLDQYTAFKSLARLLKPEGKLIISIPSMDNIEWKQARINIVPRVILTLEEYRELLEEVGLHPKRIEKVDTVDPFIDRQELLEFLMGTLSPNGSEVKLQELIIEYIRLRPEALLPNSVIEMRLGRIEIEAVKK